MRKRKNSKSLRCRGGFNFCLKFQGKYSEQELKRLFIELYKMEIFTQEDFCAPNKDQKESFWIRLSCAELPEQFIKKFSLFKQIIEM